MRQITLFLARKTYLCHITKEQKTHNQMKKATFLATAAVLTLTACTDRNMNRDADGNYVINTTELCADVKGYHGATPLNVTITPEGVISKIEALPNQETPAYFRDVEDEVIAKLVGKNVNEAGTVDAVSGATFSSNAVIKNVKTAAEYFSTHK